ncbi:hypothetical protein OY671_011599, partial [Metschnikowia pulcherrima]
QQRRHLHRPCRARIPRRRLHQPVPGPGNRPLARTIRRVAARHRREQRAGHLSTRLRHRIAGSVPVDHAGAHPQLRRGQAARLSGRLPQDRDLQPHPPQSFQLGLGRAGGGAGRRGRPPARTRRRSGRAVAAAVHPGTVGGGADPQARPDHGSDPRPDAGL